MRFELLIAWRHLLVVEGRQLDGLASGTQVRSAPGTLQRLGDVRLIVVAVGVAQLRQARRVALAREDGLEDSHAGHPGARTDDLGALAMHRFSGFVPRLHRVGGGGQEHLPMTHITTQHAPMRFGPKGTSEEPGGMPTWQPLASEAIGLRSTRDTLGLAGIDQEHLQAPGFSQCKQGNPVDPGGFHGDGGDATVAEPVGEGVEVSSEGAETAHGLGGAPPATYLLRVFVDIDRQPPDVVTVYRTSKITKYWKGTT
jgi:hypothetical protein